MERLDWCIVFQERVNNFCSLFKRSVCSDPACSRRARGERFENAENYTECSAKKQTETILVIPPRRAGNNKSVAFLRFKPQAFFETDTSCFLCLQLAAFQFIRKLPPKAHSSQLRTHSSKNLRSHPLTRIRIAHSIKMNTRNTCSFQLFALLNGPFNTGFFYLIVVLSFLNGIF